MQLIKIKGRSAVLFTRTTLHTLAVSLNYRSSRATCLYRVILLIAMPAVTNNTFKLFAQPPPPVRRAHTQAKE